jgi:dihydrofolate reductase
MRMQFVVAVSENDVIGRRNQLPWRLSADLRRFKTLTLGKPVLMGRKTYESIGHALPGRLNLVLSRSSGFAPADCTVVPTLQAAWEAAGATAGAGAGAVAGAGDEPLMVIGGGEIFRQCAPDAERIHLTLVHAYIEDGDAFFDGWRSPEWREVSRERHAADDKNSAAYSFITLERSASGGSNASMRRSART